MEKKLLDIIACPKCKGDLFYDEKKDILICKKCSLAYPVKDGIPILIIEEAKEI
uniref:UPF0434 protein ENV67_02490 n=1 Tax=candidate division WOR-3 bacterium TaxID=2052148 RepID=A0A7C4U6M9_UNCW3